MDAAGINLSAGLVPAAPPPPPAAGGIDLSAGMMPTGSAAAAAPSSTPAGGTGGIADAPTIPSWSDVKEGAKGALKDAAQIPNTVVGWLDRVSTGADRMLDKAGAELSGMPEEPEAPTDMRGSLESAENKIAPGITNPIHGQDQETGAIMSQIGQWMTGEGILKATMSTAEKSTMIAKMMTTLEKNPALAKAVSATMKSDAAAFIARHGAVAAGAGAQTLAHGGTPGQAGEAAAIAGGTGAVIEGAGAGGKATLERLAKPATTTGAVEDAAKDAVARRVAETNAATRGAQPTTGHPEGAYKFTIGGTPTTDTTEGSIAQQPRKAQIGTRAVAGKGPTETQVYTDPATGEERSVETSTPGAINAIPKPGTAPQVSHKSPTYRMSEEPRPGTVTRADSAAGGGTLITEDPKVAAAHLASLDEIIRSGDFDKMPPEQQAGYQAQRDDMQKQISGYYQHQRATGAYAPNFPAIDAKRAVDATGDFSDARAVLHQAAAQVYEHANNATGGEWQRLDKHINDLYDKLDQLPDLNSQADARAAVRSQIGEAQDAMFKMLEDPKNGFNADDVAQAKKNFRAGYVLQGAHEAVKPIYAIEQQPGRVTGRYRGFNGQQLGAQWKEFLEANPDAKQVIGGDRVDTLSRLFKANETMASRRRFGDAVLAVAGAAVGFHLGGLTGAGEGAIGAPAIRYVLDGLVSSPKVAKSLLFAIDAGARAQSYAPGLAKMIETAKAAGRATIPVAAEHIAQGDGQQ